MTESPSNSGPGTESTLLLQSDLAEPVEVSLPAGRAVVVSRANPAREGPNEDAAAILPAGDLAALLVVADGMGGSRQGGEAAATVVKKLAARIPAGDPEHSLRASVLDGIEEANHHIQEKFPSSGTTLAAVEVQEHTVRPYHIGDSTILVIGQRGKLKLQTVSHSPVGFAVESGLLDAREALSHDDLHLISNALGSPDMRIELGAPLELARFDTLLIASDGLTDNVHLSEIIKHVRKGPLSESVNQLAALASERMSAGAPDLPGKPDDLTIVAYRRSA